jgi:hypothetical protein
LATATVTPGFDACAGGRARDFARGSLRHSWRGSMHLHAGPTKARSACHPRCPLPAKRGVQERRDGRRRRQRPGAPRSQGKESDGCSCERRSQEGRSTRRADVVDTARSCRRFASSTGAGQRTRVSARTAPKYMFGITGLYVMDRKVRAFPARSVITSEAPYPQYPVTNVVAFAIHRCLTQ